jgi:trigger factor
MQVTETLSEGLRRRYAVCVPASDIESRAKARLAELGKNLRLPGFRPGKVPANLVRQRYGTSVMAEVLQDAVNGIADRVIAERQLRPAGRPMVSLEGEPPLVAGAPADLNIKVEMELLPEIVLPDLAAISLTRLRAEPSEEAVATALDNLAKRSTVLEDIEEVRPAVTGDVLVVDFTGFVDGVAFPGGAATDAPVEIGGGGFIPGFTEQLEGLSPGESRTIEVTFPAVYQAAELAGKQASFEVTAKGLKRQVIPAQDDALAEKLGLENFEKLREAVVAQIQAEYDQMSRLRIKRELLDALFERADFPSPEGLLEAEFAAIWQRVEQDRREGRIDDEDRDKDEAVLREEYRAIADRRVKLGLLLSDIGRLNEIQVSQAELSQALRTEASRYPGQEMQVIKFFQENAGAIEQLRGPIFEDKVVDYILTVARVAERVVPPEELALPDAAASPVPKAPQIAAAPAEEISAEIVETTELAADESASLPAEHPEEAA